MGIKKPAWLKKAQEKTQSGVDAIGDGVRSAGRAIDKHVIQPVIARPIKKVTKAATGSNGGNIAKSIGSLFRRSRFWRMPKPRIVQKAQTAVQKAADKVGQGAKDVAKQTGQAVTKAADKVGDVVRPAAQSVAKEVGHIVNPAIGEVALRGKQLAKSSAPVLKRIGDKLGDAGDAIGDVVSGRKSVLGTDMVDRGGKSKMPGSTDTGLVDTSGMTPEQKIAYERFLAQRKLDEQVRMSDRTNAYDDLNRMRDRYNSTFNPEPSPGEPMFPQGIIPAIIKAAGGSSGGGGGGGNLPPEGVRVADAGNDGWRSYDQGRQENRTILDDIIENPVIKPVVDTAGDIVEGASEGAEKAVKAGAEGLKKAWETVRPDRVDTRVFVSTFEDWATPAEIEAYRRADHDRDDAEKARIRAIAEERRRTKTKP